MSKIKPINNLNAVKGTSSNISRKVSNLVSRGEKNNIDFSKEEEGLLLIKDFAGNILRVIKTIFPR